LIAVLDPHAAATQGFLFVIVPVLFGEVILLLVALVVDNLSSIQRFPEYWI
jgi:CBS-domain-containing membrane protein